MTDDFGEREIVEGLVLSYARWIEHNYDTNVRNAALSTVMLLFLIYAVAALALGTKQAVGGRISPIVLGCSFVSLVVVTWYTGVHWQLRRCIGDRTSAQRGKTNSSGGRTNSQ